MPVGKSVLLAGGAWLVLGGLSVPTARLLIDPAIFRTGAEVSAPHVRSLPYVLQEKPEDIVAEAEKLVLAGQYDEARPALDVLADLPELALQSNFMEGYVALQQQDYQSAEERLRKAVEIAPEFTRARAELGRALLARGKKKEADEQFRIAERDKSLPQEVQDLIRTSRRVTAEKANWYLNVDLAAVADDNINNGIDRERVTLTVGGQPRTVIVSPSHLRQESFGAYVAARAGVRLRTGSDTAVSIDAEGSATEYRTGLADEMSILLALGPELSFSTGAASLQALAYQREYGGLTSSRGLGVRARFQDQLSRNSRVYVYADARTSESDYGDLYEGYSATGLIGYERGFGSKLSMGGTLFVRREWFRSEIASNTEFGAYYNLATVLPLGLRGGASLGATYVSFDEANLALEDDPREDWRLSGGLYLSTQDPVFWGLWPTLSYTHIRTDSSSPLFDTSRNRLRLNVARRF